MAAAGPANLGNLLGNFIGDRRVSSTRSLIKEFGKRILGRYPGMGEFMSRSLFGRSGAEGQITWSLSEIQKLAAANSGNSGMLNGVGTSRWPIAPTYDYLLTLDQVVGNIFNEINRIKSMGNISTGQSNAIQKRVLHPDFRPHWYQTQFTNGQTDGKGLVETEGQSLGSDLMYENGGGGNAFSGVLPGHGATGSHVRSKTAYELACDNALLLNYTHLHDIVALSQGLYKVQFTAGRRIYAFDGIVRVDGAGQPVGQSLRAGDWVNALDSGVGAGIQLIGRRGITSLTGAGRNKGTILLAQPTDMDQYSQNRFTREAMYQNTSTDFTFAGLNAAPAGSDRKVGDDGNGGAIATLWTIPTNNHGPGQNPMCPTDGSVAAGAAVPNVPTKAVSVTRDDIRTAASGFLGTHPIAYIDVFREAMHNLRIDLALRNLHMDMQVIYADMSSLTSRSTGRAGDIHAMSRFSGCPTGSAMVFTDQRGKLVPENIHIPGRGSVRNPAISGRGRCTPLVRNIRVPDLGPNISTAMAAAMMTGTNDGLPGMAFGSRTTSIGDLFGGSARTKPSRKYKKKNKKSNKKKKKKASKKKATKKSTKKKASKKKATKKSTKKKVNKTSRMFKGRAVFRGAKGGLFVRKKASSGRLVRQYI
jgi:hypothetical protein